MFAGRNGPRLAHVISAAAATALLLFHLWQPTHVEPLRRLHGQLVGKAGLACPEEEEGTFGKVIGAARLPPFYFMLLSMVTKPMVTTALFGPPAPKAPDESALGRLKFWGKQGLQLAFLALAGLQARGDLGKAAQVLRVDVGWWERLLALAVIFSASANVQAAFNAWALLSLTYRALQWAHSHGHLSGSSVLQLLGPVAFLYSAMLLLLYLPLAALLALLALPAVLAYAYLALGLAVLVLLSSLLFYFAFVKRLLPHLRKAAGPGALLSEAKTEEEAALHLKQIGKADFEVALADYQEQMAAYRATGVPEAAWGSYTSASLCFSPFIFLFVPLAARLYAGRGYWPSLRQTLGERHLAAYLGCSAQTMEDKARFLWLLL